MSKMSSKMEKKLAGANKKWKATEGAASNSFVNENVADGQYVGDLKAAELREIGDKLAVEFKFEITEAGKDGDDDAVGEEVVSRFYIETEQNIGYLKAALYRFVEDRDQIDDLDLAEDLPDLLEAIAEEGPSCKLSVRTAGEFQNVYINKVEEGSGSGGDDDDDEPKKGKGKKAKASGGKGGKGSGKKGKAADDDDDDSDDDSDDDDSDDDDGDDDAPSFEKGDTVSFKPPRSKSAKECTVVKVKGDKLDLKDEDGNKYPGILASKVEAIDPDNDSDDDDDDDDDKPAKGKKGKAEKPAKGKGKKKPADDDDDSDDDDDDDSDDDGDDDEVEIDVGSKVAFPFKGKEYTGKVTELDEDNEKVTVKFKGPDGKSITKSFSADKLEAVR